VKRLETQLSHTEPTILLPRGYKAKVGTPTRNIIFPTIETDGGPNGTIFLEKLAHRNSQMKVC